MLVPNFAGADGLVLPEETQKSSSTSRLLGDLRSAIAPPIQQLRPAPVLLSFLVGAEHERLAATRRRIAEVETEIGAIEARRDANARRLHGYNDVPKPVASHEGVSLRFFNRGARP